MDVFSAELRELRNAHHRLLGLNPASLLKSYQAKLEASKSNVVLYNQVDQHLVGEDSSHRLQKELPLPLGMKDMGKRSRITQPVPWSRLIADVEQTKERFLEPESKMIRNINRGMQDSATILRDDIEKVLPPMKLVDPKERALSNKVAKSVFDQLIAERPKDLTPQEEKQWRKKLDRFKHWSDGFYRIVGKMHAHLSKLANNHPFSYS